MNKPNFALRAAFILTLPLANAACVTNGRILPKIENTTRLDTSTCLVERVHGFNPGILPFLSWHSSNRTQIDQTCVTRQMVPDMLRSQDIFYRTVGYETYKLMPQDRQKLVEADLATTGHKIEDIALTVPAVEETVIDRANRQISIRGHMPDGTIYFDIKRFTDAVPSAAATPSQP